MADLCRDSSLSLLPFRMIRPPAFPSWRLLMVLWLAVGIVGCSGAGDSATVLQASMPVAGNQLFTLLPAASTGVRFENTLTETQKLNVFTYRNYYNGGGVAIGDLTGDGLPEIILVSNTGGPRLYLNQGKFHF